MCVCLCLCFVIDVVQGDGTRCWLGGRGPLGGCFNQQCPVMDEEGWALGVNLCGQELPAG